MTTRPLAQLVQLHKAIAHPIRLRLLTMLRGGALCVCQMTVVVELAASTVSEHLADLRKAGLVVERKDGRWVEYRLSSAAVDAGVFEPLWPALDGDQDVSADAVLLKELRRVPVADLCCAGLDVRRLSRPRLVAAAARAARIRAAREERP
jgi:ArsR family transcriptional regulator, arsenate/arsenite/antimonite-responsive transcriptional repressor